MRVRSTGTPAATNASMNNAYSIAPLHDEPHLYTLTRTLPDGSVVRWGRLSYLVAVTLARERNELTNRARVGTALPCPHHVPTSTAKE